MDLTEPDAGSDLQSVMLKATFDLSLIHISNAPINTIADYVINGTVEEVVPKLIKYYKKNSK